MGRGIKNLGFWYKERVGKKRGTQNQYQGRVAKERKTSTKVEWPEKAVEETKDEIQSQGLLKVTVPFP